MKRKSGLGRGLGALIPVESNLEGDGLKMVPVASIEPNPHQPRTHMDEALLQELAESIQEHGLIQPLIVTEVSNGRYQLIAGERRWRASQLADKTEVPVVVKEATPQEMLELAIIENVQRADLNALEEALAYQQLMDEFGFTQEQVAQRMSKGRSTIANLVRLLNLPPNVQQAVVDGRLSGAHARNLASLPTAEMQINVMNQIIKLNLNVRQTEEIVRKLLAKSKPKPRQKKVLSPELLAVETKIRDSLGTRVELKAGQKGGQVIIYYESNEDLQAIYDVIVADDI